MLFFFKKDVLFYSLAAWITSKHHPTDKSLEEMVYHFNINTYAELQHKSVKN